MFVSWQRPNLKMGRRKTLPGTGNLDGSACNTSVVTLCELLLSLLQSNPDILNRLNEGGATVHRWRQAWWQGCEAAGHVTSTIRKQKECLCSAPFLLSSQSRTRPGTLVLPTLRVVLPTSINLVKEIPYRYAHRCSPGDCSSCQVDNQYETLLDVNQSSLGALSK